MIIRSQNKKSIVNLENIVDISAHDKKVVSSSSYNSVGLLGIYSTEEKAIKVLDMICDFYIRMVDVTNNIVQAKKEDSYVFQMPSDEEIEV